MPGPTAKQIREKATELRERDRVRARDQARDRAGLDNYDPEVRALHARIDRERDARAAPDVPVQARVAGWGGDHGHLSMDARIDEQTRRARVAAWKADRNPDIDVLLQPEPVTVTVTAEHPRAGLLRLHCDGDGWTVRIRGTDFGVGPVQPSERDFTVDGEALYRPGEATLAAAARCAFEAPGGPETPVGSPVFTGSADGGDPVEHIIGNSAARHEPSDPFRKIRTMIARRKAER